MGNSKASKKEPRGVWFSIEEMLRLDLAEDKEFQEQLRDYTDGQYEHSLDQIRLEGLRADLALVECEGRTAAPAKEIREAIEDLERKISRFDEDEGERARERCMAERLQQAVVRTNAFYNIFSGIQDSAKYLKFQLETWPVLFRTIAESLRIRNVEAPPLSVVNNEVRRGLVELLK